MYHKIKYIVILNLNIILILKIHIDQSKLLSGNIYFFLRSFVYSTISKVKKNWGEQMEIQYRDDFVLKTKVCCMQ